MTSGHTTRILLGLAICLLGAPAEAGELLPCAAALEKFASATTDLASRVRRLDSAQDSLDGCRRVAATAGPCTFQERSLVDERDAFRASAMTFDEARANMERSCPILYSAPKPANPVRPAQ